VIFENADGFVIAREDLQLRGPGEYLGARQSGAPLFRFADLTEDADLIESARTEAEALLAAIPALLKGISSAGSAGVPIFSMPEA